MSELVVLKNVYVNLSNRLILHDVSLSLNSNRIITLIGPNGAGKSTLIRVILGLIKPTSGVVFRTDGISVGYVPQKLYLNNLLPITVERFMQLSRYKKTTNILKILTRVKAESLIYLSLQKLSGGEIQRVLLARALLNNPDLLVLDEPVQGVDVMGQLDLYNLIHCIRNELNCTILIVSHDLNFVMAHTDHVICLNKHICCFGSPKKVFKNLEFISMFGLDRIQEIAIYHHHHDHIHQY
ncbi:zinc ABC transporter ATP-binding protein ZnuC [Buchnera aphidicola]|uniref:Zinc ABC transporter ATP-binding protein ZnuC n=1 Tax=Buchnera aphidicola (Aphis nerii) TaxID=1241835 RepID=A0A4D6XTD2_9GAMM|nr:zinc ABC transporter ATP-binding protein ZnuC [Buchnera aphidicola]QCI18859.1 zinc ABC transporter ATP-binding protein ZnuC [Buchnera aphidicola (Aphis nerii)]